MKILGFRMKSGEDVIAEVVKENEDGSYKVKRPVVPMNVPSVDPNTGQPVQQGAIRLLKLMPFATSEEFVFAADEYYFQPYEVWKELEDYYIESTTNLTLATPGRKQVVTG